MPACCNTSCLSTVLFQKSRFLSFLPGRIVEQKVKPITRKVLQNLPTPGVFRTLLYVTLLKTMNKEVKIDISEPMELTSEFY